VTQHTVLWTTPAPVLHYNRPMRTAVLVLITALTLAGCDLVGTTAATAAGASAEVKQAQDAKKIEDQVRQQVQLDVQQHRQQLEQQEKDAQ
jgi:uncharacterized protein YceK